jgi:tetratricopeptide (TPR) repeat protein
MAQAEIDYIPPKRWWLKPLIALAVLGILGAAAYLGYRKWEPDRLARKAREYFDKGEYDSGFLSVRRALQIDPSNEQAARAVADATGRLNSPMALTWYRKVSEMNPGSASDAFAWAGTAVRLGQTAEAKAALAAVPESERSTARFQAMKGTLAINSGKMAEAEKAFQEALRLEPGSALHQYNLATLHLQSRDESRQKTARETLERLASEEKGVQSLARRSLVTFLTEKGDLPAALGHSEALVSSGAASFSDQVARLGLLAKVKPDQVAESVAKLQAETVSRPDDIALLMFWMRTQGRGVEALQWSEKLGPKVAASGPVAAARAEILLAEKNWSALQELTSTGNWGAHEYLRFAFLARAEREQNNGAGSRARWKSATAAAARDRHATMRLVWIAQLWEWQEERQETLWSAALAPAPQWALQVLQQSCRKEGDTPGLLKVAKRLAEVEPANDANQNNLAMLRLLCGEQTDTALRVAAGLYDKAPENPAFASTYGFALHVHGRSKDGLAVFQKLDPTILKHPSVAAYHAILLIANGEIGAARPYIELGKTADLLPEERALLKAAAEKLS